MQNNGRGMKKIKRDCQNGCSDGVRMAIVTRREWPLKQGETVRHDDVPPIGPCSVSYQSLI